MIMITQLAIHVEKNITAKAISVYIRSNRLVGLLPTGSVVLEPDTSQEKTLHAEVVLNAWSYTKTIDWRMNCVESANKVVIYDKFKLKCNILQQLIALQYQLFLSENFSVAA